MPRNYKRKTKRQDWSVNAMAEALDAVKNGMPYKTASKQFSVPVMSLKRRAKGINKMAVGVSKSLGSKKPVFTYEQERELVEHIKTMESRMYGLTKQDILSLAYQLAEKNKIPHPFSPEKEKAGLDWLRGFRRRHPDITLRSPESTSAARARAFNKPVVDKFFSILKETQEKQPVPPHRIYNVDETSLCTVPTKNTKVFAQTGRKQVARVTSAEREDTTTAVICCSAAGNFIPPMFIFKRQRMKIELMDGAPPGSIYACNSTGWMKLEVFNEWFDHFLAHVKPSADDPVILILDGHLSHTKNLQVILKARENHVTIICLPPHCTHKLQPLDVGVMYPLSVYHNQELEKWMNNHPGRVVSVFQIAQIFGEAYLRAAVPLNAINGFKKCGIYPLNQHVFSDVDYIAAQTTEMEVDMDETSNDSLSVLDNAASLPMDTTEESAARSNSNPGPSGNQVNTIGTAPRSTPCTGPSASLNLNPGPSQVQANIIEIAAPQSRQGMPPLSTNKSTDSAGSNPGSPQAQLNTIQTDASQSRQRKTPLPIKKSTDSAAAMSLNPGPPQIQLITIGATPQSRQNIIQSLDQMDTSSNALLTKRTCESLQSLASKLVSKLVSANTILEPTTPTATPNDLPSTSFGLFSPQNLKPLPTIQGKRSQRKRKAHVSILTSSPYKEYLEEEMKKKLEKEEKSKIRQDKAEKGKGVGKGKKPKQGETVTIKQEKLVTVKQEKNKLMPKKQQIKKGTRGAKKKYDTDSSSEEDEECIFCNENYSRDTMGEGWIRCISCLKWGHEACAGIDDDEDQFVCDFCTEHYHDQRKQLKF